MDVSQLVQSALCFYVYIVSAGSIRTCFHAEYSLDLGVTWEEAETSGYKGARSVAINRDLYTLRSDRSHVFRGVHARSRSIEAMGARVAGNLDRPTTSVNSPTSVRRSARAYYRVDENLCTLRVV